MAKIVTLKDKDDVTLYPQVTIDSFSGQVDNEPTEGSDNLVKSDGVAVAITQLGQNVKGKMSTYESVSYISGLAVLSNEGFIREDGTIGTNEQYRYTNKVDISGCSFLQINSRPSAITVTVAAFYDSNENFIKGVLGDTPDIWVARTIEVPDNAKYAAFSCIYDAYIENFAVHRYLWTSIITEQQFAKVEEEIQKEIKEYVVATDFVNIGFVRPDGTSLTNSAFRYTDKISVKGCTKLIVHDTTKGASVSPAVFYDINENYISGYTWTSGEDQTITVPSNAEFVVCSCQDNKLNDWKCNAFRYVRDLYKSTVCYLSNSGDDANDGLSSNTPVQTFTRAKDLLAPNGILYIMEGDYEKVYYESLLDLSSFSFIKGLGKVRLIKYEQKVSSAELASGYTRVYSVTYTGRKSSQGELYCKYLYQHDIPDATTLIPTGEIHPLQFGKTHRLPSTRIYKAASISEIETTTTKPMWYFDNDASTLYFSIVEGSSLAANPVYVPCNGSIEASVKKNVDIENINFEFVSVKTKNLTGVFKNCSFGMVLSSGALILDYTSFIRLVNCEAYASDNDGFNTHNQDTTILPLTTVFFENCWGHDCADDGESCHEHCLVIHHGGLYEYNGNGVTPASGGNGEYHDVTVRNCGDHAWVTDNGGTGFSAQGDSMNRTSIVCYGCLSIHNKIGFRSSLEEGSYAVNCVSKGDILPFQRIEQINCATIN